MNPKKALAGGIILILAIGAFVVVHFSSNRTTVVSTRPLEQPAPSVQPDHQTSASAATAATFKQADPKDIQEFRRLNNGGQSDAALAMGEKMLQQGVSDPGVLTSMAEICLSKKDIAKAEIYVSQALQIVQNDNWALRVQALVYKEKKQYKEAEADLDKVVEKGDQLDKFHALATLRQIYLLQGDKSRAEECYNKALKIKPSDSSAMAELGKTEN